MSKNRPVMSMGFVAKPKQNQYGSGVKAEWCSVPLFLNQNMDPKALKAFEKGFKILSETSDLNARGNPKTPAFHADSNAIGEINTAMSSGRSLDVTSRAVWAFTPKKEEEGEQPDDLPVD